MLTSEFEELSGRPVTEYEAANKLYMELPNLDKRDFCLLWGIYGSELDGFKAARRALELAEELHGMQLERCLSARPTSEIAFDTLQGVTAQLHSLAVETRAELLKPEYWSRKAVSALRQINA